MGDPYDNGTPKYSTAQDIYDALCALVKTEEMSILSQMFPDVSYDGQEYYYTDRGHELKTKFEELSDWGNKMWLMDLAVWQIDQSEIHELVYDALNDSDLAKRLGFKKIFIDKMLCGDKLRYSELSEKFRDELAESGRLDFWGMVNAWCKVSGTESGRLAVAIYQSFCHAIVEKARGIRLIQETQLIAECRAHLTAYDDFMLGLRINQVIHDRLEQQLNTNAYLQSAYEEKVRQLYLLAERNGLSLELGNDMKLLEEVTEE